MDSESQSSGALDINGAASVFASMIDPEPPKQDEAKSQEQSDEDAAVEALKAEQEAEPQEADAEASDEPQKFTVKIDGKDVEVSIDELKNGYQRQADYTRKTMEAAEQRKAVDAEFNTARQERQYYAQQLQQYQNSLGQLIGEQNQVDWQQLLENDPVEYLKQQHLYQQRQAAFQATQQEQQRVFQLQQAEQAKYIQSFVKEQQENLLAKLPEWKDAAKATAAKAELRDYLKDSGFSDDEISNVVDHRHVLTARKAMLYDKLMAKAQTAAKKVQPLPPKVEKPGVSESPKGTDKRSSAFQKLSRSGRVEDAAAVFASIL